MTIQHLVISGGGATGIKSLGILEHLEIQNFWKIKNIKSIYATSAGAMVALLIALEFEWDIINDYILCRPWHEAFPISIHHFFDAFSKKGIINDELAVTFFRPFFLAKDISLEITMKEFYEYSKIELHFFSLELNSFQIENISYKTFPDLPILKAIHMTCALPLIICPVFLEEKCYIDGGVIHNYPLNICIEEQQIKIECENCENILAIKNDYNKDSFIENNEKSNDVPEIKEESTILDYIMIFIHKLIMCADTERKQSSVKNEILCKTEHVNLHTLKSALYSSDFRKELLNSGIETAAQFLLQLNEKEKQEKMQEEILDGTIDELS